MAAFVRRRKFPGNYAGIIGKAVSTTSDNFYDMEKLCTEKQLLLLLDEVQAGIERTGEFLGFQRSGIRPSAVAMAKGLGGGFPLGALWVSEPYAVSNLVHTEPPSEVLPRLLRAWSWCWILRV